MRRFDEYNSDDDEVHNFFDAEDDDEEPGEFEFDPTVLEMMHLDLMSDGLNQRLLYTAMEIAQRSWFWRFRSEKYKVLKISQIYTTLDHLIRPKDETS